MRREKLYLQDIIEACDDIREFIGDSDLQAFKRISAPRAPCFRNWQSLVKRLPGYLLSSGGAIPKSSGRE